MFCLRWGFCPLRGGHTRVGRGGEAAASSPGGLQTQGAPERLEVEGEGKVSLRTRPSERRGRGSADR